MFDLVVPASLGAVVLALASAGAWGMSDFGGGLLGRRAPVVGVLVTTQGVGLIAAVVLMAVRGEPLLEGRDLALSLGGGLLAVVGVGSLYLGLATGRMGIVAPVAAVITAVTPALLGFLVEGAPPPLALAGMALAVVAVVVVSRAGDHPGVDRPSGLHLALIAGFSLGLLGFVLTRVSGTYLLAPLVTLRVVQVTVFTIVIVVGRRGWRIPRASWPLAIFVGTLDLLGNITFLTAARIELAPAAVLSSLYPVITVLLAATILHERMTRSHVAGIVLAAISVAMIAGGIAAAT